MLTALEQVQENEDQNEHSQLRAHTGGAPWSPRDVPVNEESRYRQEDLHEQTKHLYSQYRDGLDSVRQQQEKCEQEIHDYYWRREQQWQRQ